LKFVQFRAIKILNFGEFIAINIMKTQQELKKWYHSNQGGFSFCQQSPKRAHLVLKGYSKFVHLNVIDYMFFKLDSYKIVNMIKKDLALWILILFLSSIEIASLTSNYHMGIMIEYFNIE